MKNTPNLRFDANGQPETPADRTSLISLATLHEGFHNNSEFSYLFASSATKDEWLAVVPISMLTMSYDGKSVFHVDEAPFAPALQYARLVFKDGLPDPDSDPKGLKGDITYLAADTALYGAPVLTAHLHHNHIGAFYNPFVTANAPTETITKLKRISEFDQYNPEQHNHLMHLATSYNPVINNPEEIRINRIENHVLKPDEVQPNPYSLYDRIIKPIEKKGKPHAKLPQNNDVLAVYNSFVYSMPSKDDMAMKIMVHPLDNSGGWNEGNQPVKDWFVAAVLPDFLYKQREQPIIHVTKDGTHNVGATRSYTRTDDSLLPSWWPDASYWGAFYIAPASPY